MADYVAHIGHVQEKEIGGWRRGTTGQLILLPSSILVVSSLCLMVGTAVPQMITEMLLQALILFSITY